MSLVVGVDSYITLEYANEYVVKHFPSDSAFRTTWAGKSDADKEVLIRTSTQAIDSLKFNGRKLNYSNRLQFPRILETNVYFGYQAFGETNQFTDLSCSPVVDHTDGGLELVKQAVVENAVAASLLQQTAFSQLGDAIAGITSKKVGPVAETYNRQTMEARGARRGIFSDKVYTLLAPWLAESYISL